MTSAFGFILVLVKCYFSRSVAGISLKSIQCYVVVYALRVLTVTNSKAYLPYDSYDWGKGLPKIGRLAVHVCGVGVVGDDSPHSVPDDGSPEVHA